jgi:hypothetical protein
MPALGSLFANGDVQKGNFLNNSGGTTGDYFALIDEAISSANDTDYIRGSANGNDNDPGEIVIFNITNMPSDFVSITSLTYNVRYRQFNRVDDTVTLQFWIERSDGTDLTNVVTISGITSTAFTNTGAVNFTLTTAGTNGTKTDWDAARLVFAQNYTTSMSSDGAYAAVSAVELTGQYVASSTVTRTASSSGTGSSTAPDVVVKLRDASASGTGSSSASGTRVVLRTATSSGLGSSTATRVVTDVRTASSSGTGSSFATRLVTRVRTASASGTGSSVAVFATTVTSTASSSATGSSVVVSAKLLSRSATSSGVGTATGDWLVAIVASATSTGTGSSSVIFIRTLVRTASELGSSSSDIVSGRAVSREANSNGYGFTEKALWVNAGTSSDIYITIRQKNSVGFSRNDPRDQRILFRKR